MRCLGVQAYPVRLASPYRLKKLVVPCTGSLLQAIEGLVEIANKVGASRILKPERLGAAYCLSQGPMKNILHIELMHQQVA